MKLEIIFEDNHLISINKPNGYLVHGDHTGDRTLEEIVKEYIKEHYNKPGEVYLQPCHRLDRPVSGALIFAKTSKGRDRMRQLFTDQGVKKTYYALTTQAPQQLEGKLTNWLLKDKVKNVVTVIKGKRENAVQAITEYKTIGQVGKYCLIRLHPLTGKSHQLRVHMQLIGSPIVGDLKYGGETIRNPSMILLHCREMEFVHPVQKIPILIKADPPEHQIWDLFRDLIIESEFQD